MFVGWKGFLSTTKATLQNQGSRNVYSNRHRFTRRTVPRHCPCRVQGSLGLGIIVGQMSTCQISGSGHGTPKDYPHVPQHQMKTRHQLVSTNFLIISVYLFTRNRILSHISVVSSLQTALRYHCLPRQRHVTHVVVLLLSLSLVRHPTSQT